MGIKLKFGGKAMVVESSRQIGSKTPTASVTTTLGTIPIVADSVMGDGHFFCVRFDNVPAQVQDQLVENFRKRLRSEAHMVRTRVHNPCHNAHRGKTNKDEAEELEEQAKGTPAKDMLYRLNAKQYGDKGSILEKGSDVALYSGGRIYRKDGMRWLWARHLDLGKIKSFALL